jgi:metaxin
VFAYTHLLLDEDLGWVDRRLGWEVMARGNLVRHRRRLYKRFFA